MKRRISGQNLRICCFGKEALAQGRGWNRARAKLLQYYDTNFGASSVVVKPKAGEKLLFVR